MTTEEDTSERPANMWTGKSALVMPGLLVGLGLFLIWGNLDMEVADDSEIFGPKAFPWICAGLCFVIAAIMAYSIIRNPELPEHIVDENGKRIDGRTSNRLTTFATIASFVVFAILLIPAGWIIAGAIVFWGVTVGLGSRKYVANLLIGLALSSIMQLIFSGLLGLTLPPGVMGLF